jgi:hypothetical protein
LVSSLMASFNFNDASNVLFDFLCSAGGEIPKTRKKMSFLPSKNFKEEFAHLKKIKNLKSEFLLHDIQLFEFNCDSSRYIGFIGLSDEEANSSLFDVESIFDEEASTAHYLLLASKGLMSIKSDLNKDEIVEDLLYQQDDTTMYNGHDFEDIKHIFKDIVLLRIEPDCPLYDLPSSSIAFTMVCDIKRFISLPFNESIRDFKNLFLSMNKIPKENVFLALTSTHYKHTFLELYRCIEWLYTIPRALKLKESISYNEKASILALECISQLSWRRQEQDSLDKLIEKSFDSNPIFKEKVYWTPLFSTYVDSKTMLIDSKKISKYLYSLRNQFVHQFKTEDEVSLSDSCWEQLIRFTLELIDILYSEFNNELA